MPIGATQRRRTLLDTSDLSDAHLTGRAGPEDHHDGMGLLIAYDESGSYPVITVDGPDGSIEFRGIEEIRAADYAIHRGASMAESFGPPRVLLQHWQQANAR